MEGRLVPSEPGRFQSFPRQRWADEFALAGEVPLSYIEWIYDLYGADENPLGHDPLRLRELSETSGIGIPSVCADCFMELPFVRCSEAECLERQELLNRLVDWAGKARVNRVVLPFVDASRMATAEDETRVVRVIEAALPKATDTGVELHLETDLSPTAYANLLNRLAYALVKVNYDSGNSAALGYLPAEEFAAYGDRIGSFHMKDRLRGGGTVPLGTGATDFRAVFSGLEKIGYRGDITLQVARSEAGCEVEWAKANLAFIARYWQVE